MHLSQECQFECQSVDFFLLRKGHSQVIWALGPLFLEFLVLNDW